MGRRTMLVGAVVGVPVSVVFLWLAVREVEISAVVDTLEGARIWLVAGAVAMMAAVYTLQAERWRGIAAHVPSSRRLFVVLVVSGVAVNNMLPGRAGDVLRARWLARDISIPGGRALATVIFDRGFDLLALVVFLVASLPFVTEDPWLDRIVVGGLAGLGALALVLLFARQYTARRRRERRVHRGLLRRVARDTAEGLAVPLGPRRTARAALLSGCVWVAWGIAAWLVARSVGVELSVLQTAFVAAVMNLGVAIPSSPGFIGTYQWLAVASLGLFDVDREDALAFAILMQAVWYVPTTVVGGGVLVARAACPRRARARPAPTR